MFSGHVTLPVLGLGTGASVAAEWIFSSNTTLLLWHQVFPVLQRLADQSWGTEGCLLLSLSSCRPTVWSGGWWS